MALLFFNRYAQLERTSIAIKNGQSLLSAPYGIYQTKDGYIALAMIDIHVLADTIHCTGIPSKAGNGERTTVKVVA